MVSGNSTPEKVETWGSWNGNLNGCDGIEVSVPSGTMTILARLWKLAKS
jgi:hypothetical protein